MSRRALESIDVHGVQIGQDGLVIQYMDMAQDLRVKGHVVLTHTVRLSNDHPDYAEDYEALVAKLRRIVANALDDFEGSEPYVPAEEPDDDNDDAGMGM